MRREQAEAVNKTHAYFHSHLEGGHARRPALPLEREDALRQDLHHLPARQEARRQARARGDLQARRRGCVADRPRIPRGLRRLAVPLPQLRQRSDEDRPQEAGRLLRLLPGPARPRRGGQHQAQERMAPQGELGPRGLRRVPLRRVARDRQGAVRGRGGGGRQEGDQARVRRRPGGGERRPRASSRRRRPSSCPSRPRRTSTSPARRSGRWPRASSSRSRSSTGPTPTSSAPRRSSPRRTPASGTPTARCRRCAC